VPNLRWLLLDFTDPRFDLTREQNRVIRQRMRRIRFFDRPVFTLGLPLSKDVQQAKLRRRSTVARIGGRLPLLTMYLFWLAFVLYLPIALLRGPLPIVTIVAVMVAAGLWVMTCAIGYALARPWYRYAMYELGYEICAECGYPLYGLDESMRCPECGWRKTHRDDPPPVEWTDADRETLGAHGYDVCESCGGILLQCDIACPRCGMERTATSTRT
jgi:predicted RNA-binding Zn-ribbon protein involved in translation (DUF1610 family)